MEYTNDKKFDVQKTKGLHSAFCTNQYNVVCVGKTVSVDKSLKKF